MNVSIEILQDSIAIRDTSGEIVYWHESEWIEDPSTVLAIANAIRIACTQGPLAIRALINKGES